MKKQYETEEGEIVELEDKEYIDYPLNAKLTLVENKLRRTSKKIDKKEKDKESE